MDRDVICTFCLLHGHTASSCPTLRKTLDAGVVPRISKVDRMHEARKQPAYDPKAHPYELSDVRGTHTGRVSSSSPHLREVARPLWDVPCKWTGLRHIVHVWPEDDTGTKLLDWNDIDYSKLEERILALGLKHGMEYITLGGAPDAPCEWDNWKPCKDVA